MRRWFDLSAETDREELKPAYLGKRVVVAVRPERNGERLPGADAADVMISVKSIRFVKQVTSLLELPAILVARQQLGAAIDTVVHLAAAGHCGGSVDHRRCASRRRVQYRGGEDQREQGGGKGKDRGHGVTCWMA
ncbi:hypothetical protein GCM10007388_01870 [Pseudoduganella plicata]|uniref:Uncharacterized protein n=1 Tax=Pseudoduganella plicata TaxID=321984 RepID=A0AA87XZ42_9BURK|nr:hypothetical protein GCM10007388_01870 [Pseudoduganella plicata]